MVTAITGTMVAIAMVMATVIMATVVVEAIIIHPKYPFFSFYHFCKIKLYHHCIVVIGNNMSDLAYCYRQSMEGIEGAKREAW